MAARVEKAAIVMLTVNLDQHCAEVPNQRRRLVRLGDIYSEPPKGSSPLLCWLGKDVSGEAVSADLALMKDDLSALARLFDLSRRTLAVIRQNVTLSLVTKLVALLLGVFGFVNLWIAVLADVGTSIVVTLNGLRLARAAQEPPAVIGSQHRDEEPVDRPMAAD